MINTKVHECSEIDGVVASFRFSQARFLKYVVYFKEQVDANSTIDNTQAAFKMLQLFMHKLTGLKNDDGNPITIKSDDGYIPFNVIEEIPANLLGELLTVVVTLFSEEKKLFLDAETDSQLSHGPHVKKKKRGRRVKSVKG